MLNVQPGLTLNKQGKQMNHYKKQIAHYQSQLAAAELAGNKTLADEMQSHINDYNEMQSQVK